MTSQRCPPRPRRGGAPRPPWPSKARLGSYRSVASSRPQPALSTTASHRPKPLTERDTIVLADFANSTSDPVFDDTLKQTLSVALRQSPFLNVVSGGKVGATLKLMTRPRTRLSLPTSRKEVCQRAGSKAYIAGQIATLGNRYVIGLNAVNCRSGDTLAQEQVTAASKEKVLDTLGDAAARLRGELGESLATVQKFDVPLSQATTSSLEALKAFTLGTRAGMQKSTTQSIAYYQRAVELDPEFAAAYRGLANSYASLAEIGRASEYQGKAFEFRSHSSEREKLAIAADYYRFVTGELDKSAQTYQEWIENYPATMPPTARSVSRMHPWPSTTKLRTRIARIFASRQTLALRT